MADGQPPTPQAAASPHGTAQQQQTAAALGLLQRLPPKDLDANLDGFATVAPHLAHSLEPYVTRQLKVARDPEHNRYFIVSEYNGDGGTHRSPWSNKYVPSPSGGAAEEEKLFRPSERLRRLEETFNEVFDAYKTSYYEGGVSSVYLWDLDEGFAGAFLIRKELEDGPGADRGVWDSIHILEVRESATNTNMSEYRLSTTVRLHVEDSSMTNGEFELGAIVTRQQEARSNRGKKAVGEDMHLLQVGRMIEETEISIRQSLDSLYVAKQREVLQAVRSLDSPAPKPPRAAGEKKAANE